MFATVAAANGATFVDTRTHSIGHDVCRPLGTRYVEGLIPVGDGVAPFHPNALAGPSQAPTWSPPSADRRVQAPFDQFWLSGNQN
jgi:hypothetical protein